MNTTTNGTLTEATEKRRELCRRSRDENATLDGAPAAVTGALREYAQVSRLDGRGGIVEFSWDAVRRVLDNGGRFRS